MSGGFLTKEAFEEIENTDLKLGILFDTSVKVYDKVDKMVAQVDDLNSSVNQSLRKWKKIHTGLTIATGAVAGFFGGMFRG